MSNSKNRVIESWKNTSLSLIFLIVGIAIGFIYFKVITIGSQDFSVIKVNIVKDSITTEQSVKAKLDSILGLKIQNDIQLVEKKNDGRFEVLAWSSVLVLTLLLVFITINFIVSSSKVRELVDEEIDRRTEEIKEQTKSFEEYYKNKIIELDSLSAEARKVSLEIKEYSAFAENLIKNQLKK